MSVCFVRPPPPLCADLILESSIVHLNLFRCSGWWIPCAEHFPGLPLAIISGFVFLFFLQIISGCFIIFQVWSRWRPRKNQCYLHLGLEHHQRQGRQGHHVPDIPTLLAGVCPDLVVVLLPCNPGSSQVTPWLQSPEIIEIFHISDFCTLQFWPPQHSSGSKYLSWE